MEGGAFLKEEVSREGNKTFITPINLKGSRVAASSQSTSCPKYAPFKSQDSLLINALEERVQFEATPTVVVV